MIENLVGPLLRQFGITGVSVSVLALLVAVALYARRAASVGGLVVGTASTVRHDVMVVSLVLALLLVIGLFEADMARGRELWRSVQAVDWGALFERLGRAI